MNRALKFCKENFGGRVEEIKLSSEKGDDAVIALVNRYLRSYVEQVTTLSELPSREVDKDNNY